MPEKKKSVILSASVNTPTFNNETVDGFSFVNFFFGNNGTGKTSLATELTKESNLTIKSGELLSNYNIFSYNTDFIKNNFSLKDKVKAIYTLGSINIKNQERLAEIKAEKKEIKKAVEKETAAIETAKSSIEVAKNSSYKLFWNNSTEARTFFSKYFQGFQKSVASVCDKVIAAYDNKDVEPLIDDYEKLKAIIVAAYTGDDTDYPLFKLTPFEIPNRDELLNTSIVSSDSTEFARNVKVLNNVAWITQGHEKYHIEGKKCPYCQQDLPENFEELYKSCFDEEYENTKKELDLFLKAYEYAIGSFISEQRENLNNALPTLDLKSLIATLDKLEANYKLNYKAIEDKIANPSEKVSLVDLSFDIKTIQDYISVINTQIAEHKKVIADRKNVKAKCPAHGHSYLAFLLRNEIEAYKSTVKDINEEIKKHQDTLDSLLQRDSKLDKEAIDLGANAVSAEPVVKAINETIKHSGFQGFHLEWNEADKSSYQVVYNAKNGRGQYIPATKLSEGETNFIAFLYFYYMAVNTDENGTDKDSIVIIDDPVSSMDSQTLFIVSSLIKNLIDRSINASSIEDPVGIKENNIAQIFILTHNVYFHANITPEYESNYEAVNFYQITKSANKSKATLKTTQLPDGTLVNVNPIKNSYAALWRELEEVETSISACNIIHRILGYYFLNLCGYTNKSLENKLLREKADMFLKDADGNETEERYNLVRSFLEFLGHSQNIVGNEVYYVDGIDVQACRDTLKLVFDAMNQSQHYNMMIKQR